MSGELMRTAISDDMAIPMPSDCRTRAERDFCFDMRILDHMIALGSMGWERDQAWLWRLEGPSEAVH